MTTLVLNYSQSLLEGFRNGLKKTLQGIMLGYAIARQQQANQRVAEQISRYEYNGQNYWVILNDLNAKTAEQLRKEFGGE